MPSFHPAEVERRWQQYWETHATFRTPDPTDASVQGKPKYYILDMFPYPSGSGLHVGHPEGYTATDILARMKRMQGFHVLHPMGWDAFGLPAEQHAISTGEHPRINTQNNINNFRRQIKSLGFSYDWQREVDTTDPDYFQWTQWIFLTIYNTWYDPELKKGRPIEELSIPEDIQQGGSVAIQKYQDSFRLAYQAEVPVNWCPALGTVLSNEEVIDGKSERGRHPVVRRPLRQWLMRITAYADRLIDDLEPLDWSESIKQMQRNWIGRSEGAEVNFAVDGHPTSTISVFTTRPDTLFGATYMVLSPEHHLVEQITTSAQRVTVQEYQETAARKSDFERTEVAKKKTGVFTGAYARNPVNDELIPIWIADYVLATYGTGAIMAVPAHDERDFVFAKQFQLQIQVVVLPLSKKTPIHTTNTDAINDFSRLYQSYFNSRNDANIILLLDLVNDLTPERIENATTQCGIRLLEPPLQSESCFVLAVSGLTIDKLHKLNTTLDTGSIVIPLDEAYGADGVAINSGFLDNMQTEEAKSTMITWLEKNNLGMRRINYKLRDWLFSRQRYWGEPFPILHGADGEVKQLNVTDLPLTLPEVKDYKPTGSPDGPLALATDWLHVQQDGKAYIRETNTMPQWAGSCWYYLRYIDPQNRHAFADPEKLKHWLPVDLYIGGAEHAVLHLLYSRFWHKVLYDRGYLHCPEPFHKLVNQGMILGEYEYHIPHEVYTSRESDFIDKGFACTPRKDDVGNIVTDVISLTDDQIEKRKGKMYIKELNIEVFPKAEKMSKSRGNVVNPDDIVKEYGADSLRLYEMFMGPLEAVKPWSTKSVEGVYRFLNRVWRIVVDDTADELRLNSAVQDIQPDKETFRQLHRTIMKVTDDTLSLRFNTAIAAMMELSNFLTKQEVRPVSVLKSFVLLLAPYAPHIAEELWRVLGNNSTLAYEPWPTYDVAYTQADEVVVPVLVNGKVKAKLVLPAGSDSATLEAAALADEKVKEALAGKSPKKVIVVPNKLVNIVV